MSRATVYQIAIPAGNVPRHITIEDNGALAILRDLVLYSASRQKTLSYQTGKFHRKADRTPRKDGMPGTYPVLVYDMWMATLSIALGLNHQQLENLGNFALHGERAPRSRLPLFSIQASDVSFDVLTPLILGDVALAERMIEAYPKYLLAKGSATGFCGKTIQEVTPLQLAVCVGDTDFLPVIEAGFAHLPDGQVEKHKQLKEILHRSLDFYLKKYEADIIRLHQLKDSLPDNDVQHAEINNKLALTKKIIHGCTQGLMHLANDNLVEAFKAHDIVQKDVADAFDLIDKIVDAVTRATTAEAAHASGTALINGEAAFKQTDAERAKPLSALTLVEMINRLREEFKCLNEGEVMVNHYYLQKAFNLYVAQFNTWNPAPYNTWEKCDLFWRQIIGFIQRFLPANLAQAFAQGIYYIVEDKETLNRSFNFRHDPGHSFFPLSDSVTGLGFNYACAVRGFVWGGWGVRLGWLCAFDAVDDADVLLQNLCRAKTIKLGELMLPSPASRAERRCVIQ